jgi:hypothetical protein
MNDVSWNQIGTGQVVMADKFPGKPAAGTGKTGKLKSSGKLNREIQAELGQQLRRMYNDVVEEGVPDKFANLLAELDKPADLGGGDKDKSSK